MSAEALTVIQALTRVLRPLEAPTCDLDFAPYVNQIYGAVFSKLRATDIDQEVKEKAIGSMGQLIACFGDYLNGELGTCLPILLERLKNEMTRLTTVRALTAVSNSPIVKIDLRDILPAALPLLAEFLRKNQRALKLGTLHLLDSLVLNYTQAVGSKGMAVVLVEVPPLVHESDLQISQLALLLISGELRFLLQFRALRG